MTPGGKYEGERGGEKGGNSTKLVIHRMNIYRSLISLDEKEVTRDIGDGEIKTGRR